MTVCAILMLHDLLINHDLYLLIHIYYDQGLGNR